MFYYLFVLLIIYPLISFQNIRLNNINYKIMKNVFINESISFESTLGSPSKPPQENIVQKPKPIFLVNFVEDNISLSPTKKSSSESINNKPLKQKRTKTKKTNNRKNASINNNKTIGLHLLDFDALFKNIIIGEKKLVAKRAHKISNISKNKNKIKLIGYKRNRLLSNKNSVNKSKYIFLFIINIIIFIISLKGNLKKKINLNTISKGNSTHNYNSTSRYDIYDINNFCSNTMTIKEKTISHNVLIPSFEELSNDFFEDNNIEVSYY